MSFDLKKLYALLPALYRIRDTELGIRLLTADEKSQLVALTGDPNSFPDEYINGPLKSLLTIIAEQVSIIEENLEQLYDDQFIETCAEWAVSYIGQLVGTRGLLNIPDAPFSQRGEVANTISYRRRKGTASVIEQLARDVTGWDANVVEYFQVLATTQYMNHLRPENLSMTGLRDWELLEYVNTPFDKTPRTIDVRRIEKKRGKYNIQNIGVFLWRLRNYSLTESPAYKVDDRRFTFDAVGLSEPLYNLPLTEDHITHLAEPINVPMPIGRMVLKNYLETYYGRGKSLLIRKNEADVLPGEINPPASPPSAKLDDIISICNLSNVYDSGGNLLGWAHMPDHKIAIDPVLGRIAFPSDSPPPEDVYVTYYHGFSAEMGAGEYSRAATFTDGLQTIIQVNSASVSLTPIQDALDLVYLEGGIVEIEDNEYYFETPVIRVANGKTIELRSADNCRPILVLASEMIIEAGENSTVIINGLLICGARLRLPLNTSSGSLNQLQSLQLLHCYTTTYCKPCNW